jgi:L-2-hydroxyglutarate oxidase LhgO
MAFDYDYIVIGAGINGAWTGYHLAKLKQKTLIIEQVSK